MIVNIDDKAGILYPSTLSNYLETVYENQQKDIIHDDAEIIIETSIREPIPDAPHNTAYNLKSTVRVEGRQDVSGNTILFKDLLYPIRSWNNAFALSNIISLLYKSNGEKEMCLIDLISEFELDYLAVPLEAPNIPVSFDISNSLLKVLKNKYTPSLMKDIVALDQLRKRATLDVSSLLSIWIDDILTCGAQRFIDIEALESFEVKYHSDKDSFIPSYPGPENWYSLEAEFVDPGTTLATKVFFITAEDGIMACNIEEFMYDLYSYYKVSLKREPVTHEDLFEFKAFLGKFIEVKFDN